MSGTQKLHRMSPALTVAQFAKNVEEKIGVSISVGIAPNKFLAKIASDMDKPKGFFVIGESEAKQFLRDKPIRLLWGVGRATQKMMEKDGIKIIEDLQKMEADVLIKKYGAIGTRLAQLAHGKDNRKISKDNKTKSISSETTFEKDIGELKTLLPIVRELAQKVSKATEKIRNGWANYRVETQR